MATCGLVLHSWVYGRILVIHRGGGKENVNYYYTIMGHMLGFRVEGLSG